jgi:carbonic anhydrase
MSHHCSTLLLHCIDFRLAPAIKKYMEEQCFLGDCDVVSAAGAAKDIASPAIESDREFLLRQMDISKRLHNISKIVLMNHTDCGAYGGKSAFASKEAEIQNHLSQLESAKKFLSGRFPDLRIETVVAEIGENGQVRIPSSA